jgi:hypothetical protein
MRDGGSDKRGIIKAPAQSGRLSSEVTSPECSLDAIAMLVTFTLTSTRTAFKITRKMDLVMKFERGKKVRLRCE